MDGIYNGHCRVCDRMEVLNGDLRCMSCYSYRSVNAYVYNRGQRTAVHCMVAGILVAALAAFLKLNALQHHDILGEIFADDIFILGAVIVATFLLYYFYTTFQRMKRIEKLKARLTNDNS